MEMTSLHITLPEPLKVFIEQEAEESGYANAGDYIRELIIEAEQRKSAEALEALLMEGLDVSQKARMSDAEWEAHKQQHRAERLEALRRDIARGLDDLAHGRVHSEEEVFQQLEALNREAMNRK
jgi:antitoxin ParD1/3/4